MENIICLSLLIYIIIYFNYLELGCSEASSLDHVVSTLTSDLPIKYIYYNVKSFGAKGDALTDDSKAFQDAMAKACIARGARGVMLVPAGYTFLLQTIKFDGTNCQPGITVQIDGKIVAPAKISDWRFVDFQWIRFAYFRRGITIKGKGIVDGQGGPWWKLYNGTYDDEPQSSNSISRPHAINIFGSNNVTITGIRIQNSPCFHFYIDFCQQVTIFNLSVWSPENSPNTDGIHLSLTQHVDIHNTTLACGDDCISMVLGCSDIRIYDVHCGPGHGYSIGSLGFNKSQAQVSSINVHDSTVVNSMTGVRIKTWEGGLGNVRNITFSNIKMSNVQTPIVIDQEYCGGRTNCSSGDKNAIAISGVTYQNIKGTYTYDSISLVCSRYVPCRGITMSYIDLTPSNVSIGSKLPNCTNAYGKVLTKTKPPLNNCLLPDS